MKDIQPTDEQYSAIRKFFEWFASFKLGYSKRFFYISGPAGTGKTTICKFILEELYNQNKNICCCSFTGKAAVNFREKTGYDCNTIHSCIYKPVIVKGVVKEWRLNFGDSPCVDCDLILIDEVSMVYKELWDDLLKYNKPILIFGDPYQLPPVQGDLLFHEKDFDFLLTHIHRQALENPIIRLSKDVREGKEIPFGNYDNTVVKIRSSEFDWKNLLKFDQILCGRNATRNEINDYFRMVKKFSSETPLLGDKLICLRNNRDAGVYNGQIFNALSDSYNFDKRKGLFDIRLDYEDIKDGLAFTVFDDEFVRGSIRDTRWKILNKDPFICQFDYAYAITVHKSQGSEWDNICVFDESFCFREDRKKWEYTAITRASKRIMILR